MREVNDAGGESLTEACFLNDFNLGRGRTPLKLAAAIVLTCYHNAAIKWY
jgi:hypothetical protein